MHVVSNAKARLAQRCSWARTVCASVCVRGGELRRRGRLARLDKNHDSASAPPSEPSVTVVNNQGAPGKQETKTKTEAQQNPEKTPWGDVPTWLLVGVGIVAAYIGLQTLADIKKQTKNTRLSAIAARNNAKAALLSAKALVNAERAWIDVGLKNLRGLYVEFSAINYGKTPAQITDHYLKWAFPPSIVNLPSAEELFPTTIEGTVTHNRLLAPAPGDEWWTFDTLNGSVSFGVECVNKLRAREDGSHTLRRGALPRYRWLAAARKYFLLLL